MSRRLTIILGAAGAALIVLVGAYFWLSRTLPVLTVATWSGAYGRAQANAMFRTYGDAKSYDVRIALYDGGLTELQQMVGNKRYDWDVMDFELPDAIAGLPPRPARAYRCRVAAAGADGTPAAQDFVKNAVGPCWVGSVVYAQVMAYSPRRFGEARPQTIADFFDLARFPGPPRPAPHQRQVQSGAGAAGRRREAGRCL